MDILHISPDFPPRYGGVGRHVYEISEELKKKGFHVKIITFDNTRKLPRNEVMNGIEVFRCPSYELGLEYPNPLFVRIIKRQRPDILHVHSYQDFTSPLSIFLFSKKVPIVMTPHFHPVGKCTLTSILRKIYHPLGIGMFRRVEKIICVSPIEQSLLQFTFGISGEHIELIPHGVNLKKFKKLYEIDLRDPVFSILFVGRLEKYKGILNLLRAFERLTKRYDKINLTIVGDGPLREEVRKEVLKLGLFEKVKIYRILSDQELIAIYGVSNVLVLPSSYEAFGLVVLEAMACGVPVIASKVGGLPYLVLDNETGFLIRFPTDTSEIIEKLELLIENKEIEKRMSETARNFVQTRFSLDRSVQKLIHVYGDLCKSS